MTQFNDERLVTVAVGLLPLQKCINDTIEYARDRSIFGKTLLDQQYVQFRLAELEAELEATRSLLYRTVLARCQGEDVSMLTAMAKLKIGRLARKVTDQCLQVSYFFKAKVKNSFFRSGAVPGTSTTMVFLELFVISAFFRLALVVMK